MGLTSPKPKSHAHIHDAIPGSVCVARHRTQRSTNDMMAKTYNEGPNATFKQVKAAGKLTRRSARRREPSQ